MNVYVTRGAAKLFEIRSREARELANELSAAWWKVLGGKGLAFVDFYFGTKYLAQGMVRPNGKKEIVFFTHSRIW